MPPPLKKNSSLATALLLDAGETYISTVCKDSISIVSRVFLFFAKSDTVIPYW